jgi:hypothetical protein
MNKTTFTTAGFEIPNDMPLDEIDDMYDALINTAGGLVYDTKIREQIPFPLYASSLLFIDRIPKLT